MEERAGRSCDIRKIIITLGFWGYKFLKAYPLVYWSINPFFSIDFFLGLSGFWKKLPSKESNPQAIHITKLIPTDPVRIKRPDGDTKIPEPKNEKNKSLKLFLIWKKIDQGRFDSCWNKNFVDYSVLPTVKI